MQYCCLQHQTLLLSPVTSTTGYCVCFGSITSFFLELFLHWSPVAHWAPTDLGSSSFSSLSFCLFILFMGFWRQEYWSGLPFPSPVDLTVSKFSKPGFSNTWTVNFQMFKLVLEKAEEPEIKLPASAGSWKKQESSRKTSISALLTMPKLLTVWITINCGHFWKRWQYQTTWPASWETYMQVRKQQLELSMEQQTGSK